MLHVHPLSWDSDFFRLSIGKIQPRRANQEEISFAFNQFWENGGDLVYWASDPDDSNSRDAAIYNNGILIDNKTTFHAIIENIKPVSIKNHIYKFDPSFDNRSKIVSLAVQAGQFSRFNIDPRMPEFSGKRLYECWIEKSFSGELADEIFIAKINNEIVGLVTVSAVNQSGDIGLLSVDSESRGQGIGKDLVSAALQWCSEKGCNTVSVVTQGNNLPACQVYSRSGFKVFQVDHYYHFWRNAR